MMTLITYIAWFFCENESESDDSVDLQEFCNWQVFLSFDLLECL